MESVLWDHAHHTNAYHKGRNFECSQTDGGRHSGPCLVRGAQRDSVGGMVRAPVVQLLEIPIQTQSCSSSPSLWKTKFRRTNFQRCCRNRTGVHERVPYYHAHSTRITKKEWASSAARQTEAGSMGRAPCEECSQTEVHSSTSTRWPGNQCEPSAEFWTTCATRRTFFKTFTGLHWPWWLYVLGMPPRGYLPIFAALNPQSTCRGPRPGPTLAPWCLGGLPACPGADGTRKDPRPEEKKMAMCK